MKRSSLDPFESTSASGHLDDQAIDEIASDARRLLDAEASHISSCDSCRVSLDGLQHAYAAGRRLETPPDLTRLWARIDRRFDAGDPSDATRVEPSVHVRHTTKGRFGRLAISALAASVLGAIWLSYAPRALTAGDLYGELRVLTAHPRSGGEVAVEYIAPTSMANASALYLRAALRRPSDMGYADGLRYDRVAVLQRARDGHFRGRFTLPDSTVYAALAVENANASWVDSRGARYWEVLAQSSDGRIAPEAFEQFLNDLYGRDPLAALAVAREWARVYPESPNAWGSVRAFERINLGALADTALATHKSRFMALYQAGISAPQLSSAVLGGLSQYAVQFDDDGDPAFRAARQNLRKLKSERVAAFGTPARSDVVRTDPIVAEWTLWSLNARATAHPESASVFLEATDAIWERAPQLIEVGTTVGSQIARFMEAGAEAQLRWADRFAKARRNRPEWAYNDLALRPSANQSVALSRLRIIADSLLRHDDSRRRLELTRPQAAKEDSAHAIIVLRLLANGLLAAKDSSAALDVLQRASAFGWEPSIAARLYPLLSMRGRASEAVPMMARLVVDPGTSNAAADSLTKRAQTIVGATVWQTELRTARTRMRNWYLETATRQTLPKGTTLQDTAGRAVLLTDVSKGRPTVMMFWTTECAFSVDALKSLNTAHATLLQRGVRLLVIAEQPRDSAALAALAQQGVKIATYFDANREAVRVFQQWSTPSYYVLDAGGTLRFSNSSWEHALGQAVALTLE